MIISFVGDVSFTGNFKTAVLDSKRSSNILSQEVKSIFTKSDYTICNLEGPLTTKKCIKSPKLKVKSPLASLPFLLSNNINVFGLANNHMFDAKYEGFQDTKNELCENKAIYFGAGDNIEDASKVVYLQKNNVTVAIIGVGHCVGDIASENTAGIFTYKNESKLKERIECAKNKSDWVVLFYHTGAEYNFYPTPTVRERLKKHLDFGADMIIAHHSHVMQGIEKYKKKLIVYSLGNFIFDLETMKSKKDHNIGLIITINFKKEGFTFSTQPVLINPQNASIRCANSFYQRKLEKISDFSTYNSKLAKDSLRVLFFNPFVPKKKDFYFFKYILLLPIVKIYRIYITRGFEREFVDILIKYYHLGFLSQILRKDDKYKSD